MFNLVQFFMVNLVQFYFSLCIIAILFMYVLFMYVWFLNKFICFGAIWWLLCICAWSCKFCSSWLIKSLIIFLLFDYFDLIVYLPYWFYIILILIGFGCFITYIVTNEAGYYREHVFANSNYVLVQIVWFCFAIPPAVGLASFFGWQQIIDVTALYLLFYSTGYILSRILWTIWPKIKQKITTFID